MVLLCPVLAKAKPNRHALTRASIVFSMENGLPGQARQ
jgi:hypothetical protein